MKGGEERKRERERRRTARLRSGVCTLLRSCFFGLQSCCREGVKWAGWPSSANVNFRGRRSSVCDMMTESSCIYRLCLLCPPGRSNGVEETGVAQSVYGDQHNVHTHTLTYMHTMNSMRNKGNIIALWNGYVLAPHSGIPHLLESNMYRVYTCSFSPSPPWQDTVTCLLHFQSVC